MVELIVVLILIGIIGTIAVGRFFERSTFDTAAWTDQVRATLRYGQKVAIAQNRPVFVLLSPNRIALCLLDTPACAAGDQVRAPGGANSGSAATRAACASGSWMCEGRPTGVAMAVPAASIAFDGLGRANNGAGGRVLLTISGDGSQREIGIEPETGYVD